MTISELYERFSRAEDWRRLASATRSKVVGIVLKPHGHEDADTLTRDMLHQWMADSHRPPSDTAPTESVITHMMVWSKRWTGKSVAKRAPSVKPKPKAQRPQRGEQQQTRRKADVKLTLDEWQADTRQRKGTIEHERSSKGWKNGKRVMKDNWRAVIMVNGQRYRHRGGTREECSEWLKAVLQKKILPTDNSADWWRMEQRKDDTARIDEIIVSQAEESVMLYDYHHTGDISAISDYLVKRLLPHMMYYAAHTLRLGRESAITASRQAAGLLLTRITAHRPVMNFTATCKRMLRVYKQRGDFFYYEKAPEEVKLMVNGINFDALADVWKVTKDRRI